MENVLSRLFANFASNGSLRLRGGNHFVREVMRWKRGQ